MVRKTIVSVIAAILLPLIFFSGSEAIKSRPGFCVSCHLDEGTPLHADKNRLFAQEPPVNLSGLHRRKLKGFSCTGCHSGVSVGGKLNVALVEAKNTLRYFFGKYEEPKKLDLALMPDENCEGCHKEPAEAPDSFHGAKAHRPKVKTPCAVCHDGHTRGRADYHFINEEKLRDACNHCHPAIPAKFRPAYKAPPAAASGQ